jgi:hypothetical protein
MDTRLGTCPLTRQRLVDEYFMEHRTKVLDIAAFLDRLDRSTDRDADNDFRMAAFREAVEALCSRAPGRVEKVQMIFSDPTTEPLAHPDGQNASGASDRKRGVR